MEEIIDPSINKYVELSSGFKMPVLGLGTYALKEADTISKAIC
jgi:diketogulonate reductase-like aldo/keto reductase